MSGKLRITAKILELGELAGSLPSENSLFIRRDNEASLREEVRMDEVAEFQFMNGTQ
jgi:hypothetical protein